MSTAPLQLYEALGGRTISPVVGTCALKPRRLRRAATVITAKAAMCLLHLPFFLCPFLRLVSSIRFGGHSGASRLGRESSQPLRRLPSVTCCMC